MIKIPKKVAEALDRMSDVCPTRKRLFELIIRGGISPNAKILLEYAEDHFNNLAEAIINGYEVDQTPEDEIKERYNALGQALTGMKTNTSFETGYLDGVQFVLEKLGRSDILEDIDNE